MRIKRLAALRADNARIVRILAKSLGLIPLIGPSAEKFVELVAEFFPGSRIEKGLVVFGCKKIRIKGIPPSSTNEVSRFYSGSHPSWGVIAADGDVRRHLEKAILETLQKKDEFRIICIIAEPGAGKSTLARRLAYELLRKGETVFHLYDNSNPHFWYGLSQLAEVNGSHFYILIDDIFRYDEFVRPLQNIPKEHLKVTVIATSRSSEFEEARGLEGYITKFELKLNRPERLEFLKRIGKSYQSLSSSERRVLEETDQFLVLAMMLTKGKSFDAIIKEVVDQLKDSSASLHEAYQYICFSHTFGLLVPEDLLARAVGAFDQILKKVEATGVIYGESLPQYPAKFLRTAHQLIAAKGLEVYERHYPFSAKEVLARFLKTHDERDAVHRRFILSLLQSASRDGDYSIVVNRVINENAEKLSALLSNATISDLGVWRSICEELNRMDEAKKCSEEIMAREPRSTLDAQVLATEFLSRNLKQKAFLALSSWLEGRPDDTSIFVRSMSLAKEIGDKASVERIMKKASAWLRVHAGDKAVRSSLLTLVRHSGTQDQVKEAIEQTFAWLEEHADDNHVRQAYLIVVRERGNSEQVKKAVDNTLSWLKEHPDDITIRSAFLPLVRDRGFLTIDDIRSALRDAEQWMKQHCPSPLFPQYLTLVRKVRKTEIDIQIGAELVKDLGYEFLNSCNWKDAAQAVDSFARWLSEEKFYAESESIYEKIPTDELPEAVKADVYFGYAMLFLAQAMNLELSPRDRMERLVKAEEKLRDALKAVKGHMARAYLAICLAEQRRPKEAAEEFNHVEWWARHTGMTPVTYTKYSPGKLFAEIAKFYLQFGRFEEAKYWYHRACDEEPKNFANWWGLGRATMGLGAILEERGRFEDAAKLYTDAISGLQKAQQFAPKPLQLPASRDIPQQIAECERRSRPP